MCLICDYEGTTLEGGFQILDCHGCKNITSIPVIKGLQQLYCGGCTNLESLPNIPGLQKLIFWGCEKIKIIPNIKTLLLINCMKCPGLTSIPEIKGLKHLNCTGCTNLINLPKIDDLRNIYCKDCPWLKHFKNPNYEENIRNLVILQKFFKRILASRKLLRIAPILVGVWYSPGCHGAWLAEREFVNTIF